MSRGKSVLLLACIILGFRITQPFAQIHKRPLTMTEMNPIQNAPQLVHNQKLLHLYDLFRSRINKHLQFALMTAPGVVRVFPLNNELVEGLNELRLARFDYSKYDSITGTFSFIDEKPAHAQLKDNEIIVSIDDFEDESNYILLFRDESCPIILDPSIGGIIDTYYNASEQTDFGVRLKGDTAVFKLWSPPAGRIELLLYQPDGKAMNTDAPLIMKKGNNGVWNCSVTSTQLDLYSLEGLFYQYRVFAYGKALIALDPYAFSMGSFTPQSSDKIGKGAIVNMEAEQSMPLNFERTFRNQNSMANGNDLIAYELHVRDFTSQPGEVNPKYAGTYIGLVQKAAYLKNLGVTHVQLMPVMNFYTVDENDRTYSGNNAENVNYNWGYDPHHYFTPEGWFSTNPDNPYVRIAEMRSMIQALHQLGIGVIIDVVYNHTHIVETFENIAPGCYYRFDQELKISGHSGAGPSLESRRPMVRKLMVESMIHWIEQYHVDGFRFDLMGFTDHETMRLIQNLVGKAYDTEHPDALILQGEGWVFSDLDTSVSSFGVNAATTKLNYPNQLTDLGFFNDVARDAFCGNQNVAGFVHGNAFQSVEAATAIAGGLKTFGRFTEFFQSSDITDTYATFSYSASNCVNFISIHDGLTLWDKINLSSQGCSIEEKIHLVRMSSLLLFTSFGKIILHGGDELLRTKPLSFNDREEIRAVTSNSVLPREGILFFHENSYGSSDFTNMIRWTNVEEQFNVFAEELKEYYTGLITMRRSLPAFRVEPFGENSANLKFLNAEQRENQPSVSYSSFSDPLLRKLTIQFINGPANETMYIAGEIHRKGVRDNPVENPFRVHFDQNGCGEFVFDEQQIRDFDLHKWGNPSLLEIKLVKYMGAWETIESAYSQMGNNAIDIRMIDKDGVLRIDLSVKDDSRLVEAPEEKPYLAYIMDNNPEIRESPGFNNLQCDKIMVVHNPSDKEVVICVEDCKDYRQWIIIADGNNAGIEPLEYSRKAKKGMTSVKVKKGRVSVPAKNSAVLVRMISPGIQ